MAQVIKADLDEIIFSDREKRYGAYELRRKSSYRLFLAVAIITAIVVGLVAFPSIMAAVRNRKKEGPKNVNIELTELPPPPPPTEEATPPPPPPPPPPKPQIKTVAFKVPEPKAAEDVREEEEIATVEELKDAPNVGLESTEGSDKGYFDGEITDAEVPDIVFEEPKNDEPEADAFILVQEEPKPVNMNDIKKLVGYPQIARDAGIQGDVVIRILVDEKGNYVKHKIIKQTHPILATACEAHINKLKFTPAIQGGKPIKFWVNVPFKFTLM